MKTAVKRSALTPEQQRLVHKYHALPFKLAVKYHSQFVSFEDMAAEGQLGLVLAAQRFEPERGLQFTTLAMWWVNAKILEVIIRNHGPVSVGTRRDDRKVFFNYRRVIYELRSQGVKPTREAIAEALGVDVASVEDMEARMNPSGDLSFDAERSEDDSRPAVEIEGEDRPDNVVEGYFNRRADTDTLNNVLKVLNPRERLIIAQRYLRENTRTLEDIGKDLNLSRERVRQIEARALLRMKRHASNQR